MSYLVIYGPENGTKIESTVASRGIDISGVFTARGLTPLTSYSFEVAAVNSAGTGPFTAPLVVGTDGMYVKPFVNIIIEDIYVHKHVLLSSSHHCPHGKQPTECDTEEKGSFHESYTKL